MNTPEHDNLETVLNALGSTEPAPGFHQRLQHAVHHASPERTLRWRPMHVASFSAALLLCASLGICIRWPHSSSTPFNAPRQVLPVAATAQIVAGTPLRIRRSVGSVAAHEPALTAASQSGSVEEPRPHENIPSPPLPLTAEERLVLRLMRNDQSNHLAQYTADARERRLQEDDQVYRSFFAPPPSLDGQPYYDQHIPGGSE